MTIKKVLIIGGYGNFGRYIARALSQHEQIQLIIAGRRIEKAQAFVETLAAKNQPLPAYCDIDRDIHQSLALLQPDIVIHTSGPFQGQSLHVAESCIKLQIHYIDLSDAREFVNSIAALDEQAKANDVFVCSGASSVPGLSSSIIEHYQHDFATLEGIDYAIATAQLTNQGEATTAGVLSYIGKPFQTRSQGKWKTVYGMQDIRIQKFWKLHRRLLGNFDVPDLTLFPERYPTLRTITFQAGLELAPLHLSLYALSWLSRLHLLPRLDKLTRPLLAISRLFNRFGHDNTGFYMILSGRDKDDRPKTIRFDIHAQHGDGLYIPCVPSIVLAEKLSTDNLETRGALPCVGVISLDEYLGTLKRLGLDIAWQTTISP